MSHKKQERMMIKASAFMSDISEAEGRKAWRRDFEI